LGASWPVAGLAYLGVAMVALIWLREAGGWLAVLWVLLVIWSSDIGAYLSGSLIGGPKLAPRLSPNKTWAGLIGGAVLAGVLAALFVLSAAPGLVAFSSPVALFLIGFLLAVWSQLGDILESSLKRRFNVKDSGNLIPGHGGVLDRIDSLIFTVPVVALAFFLQNPHGVPLNG
jgi:phosphatidate cytidylyltransferase